MQTTDIHPHLIGQNLMPDHIHAGRYGIPKDLLVEICKFAKRNPGQKLASLIEEAVKIFDDSDIDIEPIIKVFLLSNAALVDNLLEAMASGGIERSCPLMLDLGVDMGKNSVMTYDDQVNFFGKLHVMSGGRLYPFLGLDVRRKKYSLDELLAGKHNFYGVKLYSKLGFDPNPWSLKNEKYVNDNLFELYDFCQAMGIPITCHTSKGGIGDKKNFANPEQWYRVISNWYDLRLNLAHGGGMFTDWTDTIEGWALDFINLFIDIAYHDQIVRDPKWYFDRFMDLFHRMPGQVLFGTDYPLHLVYYSYAKFVETFRKHVGEDIFDITCRHNNSVFLAA